MINYIIVLGDLNTKIYNKFWEQFCVSYNLKSLIKKPTCIDLILKSHSKCFQNSVVYETVISIFLKWTFTVLKTYFQKVKPRIIKYRYHKHFDNNGFRDELIGELSRKNVQSDNLAQFTNTSELMLEKRQQI